MSTNPWKKGGSGKCGRDIKRALFGRVRAGWLLSDAREARSHRAGNRLSGRIRMSTLPVPYLTPEQYLEIEREAEFRSEYLRGQMYATPGGTLNHARIVVNVASRLAEQ